MDHFALISIICLLSRNLAYQEIDEFTQETTTVQGALALMRGETGFAEGEYIMRPFVPGVTLTLDMFSSKSTFAGGETYLQIDSDTMARRVDERTGETVGVYRIELEIPEDEDSYCFHYTVGQLPWMSIPHALPL